MPFRTSRIIPYSPRILWVKTRKNKNKKKPATRVQKNRTSFPNQTTSSRHVHGRRKFTSVVWDVPNSERTHYTHESKARNMYQNRHDRHLKIHEINSHSPVCIKPLQFTGAHTARVDQRENERLLIVGIKIQREIQRNRFCINIFFFK